MVNGTQTDRDLIKANNKDIAEIRDILNDLQSTINVNNYTEILNKTPLTDLNQFDTPDNINIVSDAIAEGVNNTDNKFIKTQLASIILAIIGSAFSSYLAFQYMISLFPFTIATFVIFFGLAVWLLIDYLFFPGNTLKKVAQNAIAISVFFVGFIILFGLSFNFGNSYTGNPFGNEQRIIDTSPEPTAPASSNNGVIFPEGPREPEGEQ